MQIFLHFAAIILPNICLFEYFFIKRPLFRYGSRYRYRYGYGYRYRYGYGYRYRYGYR